MTSGVVAAMLVMVVSYGVALVGFVSAQPSDWTDMFRDSYPVDSTSSGAAELFEAAKHRRVRIMRALDACSTEGCGVHGTCVAGTGCVCDQDTSKGFWTIGKDGLCSECSPGYATGTCLVECQGGSCNKCNQNGVCYDGVQGDGTCECYKTALQGFWAPPSCSQCLPGYFGSRCQNFCPGVDTGAPCANRGTCVTDASGNGACACNSGYGSDSGCKFCDQAHYSVGCSLTCPGYVTNGTFKGAACSGHGKCFNGTSANGTCVCDPFWGLEDCSKRCPNDCSNNGECSDGSLGTAMCTCFGRYAPPDCSECLADYTGPDCDVSCPVNSKNEVCNNRGQCVAVLVSNVTLGSGGINVTYVANCSCAPGYTGDTCELACAGSPPCSGHGTCFQERNASGFLLGLRCACFQSNSTGFWSGETCITCSVSHNNSAQCTVRCPVSTSGVVCSGHGYCANGFCYCTRHDSEGVGYDFCGSACELFSMPPTTDTGSCTGCGCYFCTQDFFFGQTCSAHCPGYGNGVACSGNGRCSEGKNYPGTCTCNAGYAGDDCGAKCPASPTNQQLCGGFARGLCGCRNGVTSPCVPECNCRDGFAGTACELDCPVVNGETCAGNGVCDPVTAKCTCTSQYTGLNCDVPCGCNTENGVCNATICANYPAFRVCTSCNCFGNFTGICNLCKEGSQGITCAGACVHGQTSNTSKECKCDPNWSTASCTVPCPIGANGFICSNNGTCASGNTQSGLCACNASLYGPTCDTYCTTALCSALGLQHSQCNPSTGACECLSSTVGYWTGPTCSTCQYGYWGPRCTDVCDCSGHGSCDAIQCYCSNDAVSGFFTGSTCASCVSGYIGADCNIKDVAITRITRTISGLSGSFLISANLTINNPTLHSPVASVVAVDEISGSTGLYVGGRPVAKLDTSTLQPTFVSSTTNVSIFSSTNCSSTAEPDVAYVFVDTQYHYFLMQPLNSHDDGCNVPLRLVILNRQTLEHVQTQFLNVSFNGTHDVVFNNTVRVMAATAQSDTGFSSTAVKARLSFVLAQPYLDLTTSYLAPFPSGWVVHVAVEELTNGNSKTIVSKQLPSNFVANDISMSPYTISTFSVVAVAGYYASSTGTATWDVVAFQVTIDANVVNAFSADDPSLKAAAPCWVTLTGTTDTSPCSICTKAERLHWVNNDIVFAASTSRADADTVLVWLRRVQDLPTSSSVLAPAAATGGTCAVQQLTSNSDGNLFLSANGSSTLLGKCSTVNCPEALFAVKITQCGTPTSQATAIVFDSFANVSYIAMRVNAGNSPSVIAKLSVTPSTFVVYGLLTLGYATNSLGRSKAEAIFAMAVAKNARMLYAGVSGVQSLSLLNILLYEVQSIGPDIADQRNQTRITVAGSGYVAVNLPRSSTITYPINCAFITSNKVTLSPAAVLNSTHIQCTVPTESQTESAQSCGQQTLEISLYNDTYVTQNLVTIQRAQSAQLLELSPVRGALSSVTPQVVNISGTGFQDSVFSRCKFFSNNSLSKEVLYSSVKLITPNLIQCTQPNATEASYDFGLLDVSIDGQLYTIDGPLVYEIVGQAADILNDPVVITVPAQNRTAFSFTTRVVDERRHKLDTLDTEARTFYLLINVSYDSDCSLTSWRPLQNCIPNYYLLDASYPNATTDGSSWYPIDPCYNASLNGIVGPESAWSPETDDLDAVFPIGYNFTPTTRSMFEGVKVFALNVTPHQGKVTFDNLFLVAPRVGNVTLTVLMPSFPWQATTTIVVVPGNPFALAIFNIADFQSYDATALQSANCSRSLQTKFYIVLNTPLAQIELVIIDAMANVITPAVNQYLLSANTYYIHDLDYTRVNSKTSPPAPTQRESKFIYGEITLPYIHGASHYITFHAVDRTNTHNFTTTTPPIRTQACASNMYKVPLSPTCLTCASLNSPGVECDGSELIRVLPGYWRANGSTTHVYACPGGNTICLGSVVGAAAAYNLSYCKAGHSGPLCDVCAEGYGKSGTTCVPCQSLAVSATIVSVVVFVVFVVLVIWTIVTLRNAETTDLSVIMRTVVNHMQATGALGAFAANYGPFMQSFMSGQGSAGGAVSVNGVQAFDCLVRGSGQNYYVIFAGFMCLPIVALILAIVVFGVVRALRMVPIITPELRAEIEEDIKNFGLNAKTAIIKERYPMFMVVVTTNCVIMFTLYQNIITQCAAALQCDTYVYAENSDGTLVTQSFLHVDRTISCSGATSPLTTPALVFAALYGLGIPLAFTFGYMFVNDTVNMPQLTKLMFMFLCGGYKDKLFFWQNLIMIRKLVLVLLIVFLTDELLNYCVMWVMSCALVLQVWLQPAEKDEHNLVESISLAVLVLTLNLGLLYFWELSAFATDALTLGLILVTIGVLVVFVYFLAFAAKEEFMFVFSLVEEAKAKFRSFGKEPEKKKKKLRLTQVNYDDDADLPPLPPPPKTRYGLHQHQFELNQEGDFAEYSDDDSEEDGFEEEDEEDGYDVGVRPSWSPADKSARPRRGSWVPNHRLVARHVVNLPASTSLPQPQQQQQQQAKGGGGAWDFEAVQDEDAPHVRPNWRPEQQPYRVNTDALSSSPPAVRGPSTGSHSNSSNAPASSRGFRDSYYDL